jgi:Deltex C-terminal domain
VILSSASQCIPILYFDASTIDSNAWVGNTTVDSFHVKLTKALDKSFSNAGVAVPVPLHLRKLPVFSLWAKLEKSRVDETVSYVAPLHIGLAHVQCLWVDYCTSVPEDLTKVKCSVCRHSFRLTKGERLKIVQSFAARNKVHHLACATKREDYIVGKMPSGTMSVRRSSTGQFRESDTGALTGSIVIEYTIPRAVQRFYHPNPGMEHDSTQRTAYLPNTTKGRNLLKRLKYAFRQGLTFTVGVSSTSKKADSVTWASIPHKTSRSGGSRHYGFPDANYLMHCHKQLDALHVPPAHRLP